MDSNFGFEVVRTIVITNVEQDLVANISAKFFKVIDGDEFALLDFYKSRSIRNLRACRVEGHYDRADVVKVIKQVCYDIRDLRDESFRSTVVGSKGRGPDLVTKDKLDKRFVPRSKRLRAVILAQSDTIMFKLPEVVGVVGECACESIVPMGRRNRNNQLWVSIGDCRVFDYISRIVAHHMIDVQPANEGVLPMYGEYGESSSGEAHDDSDTDADDIGEQVDADDKQVDSPTQQPTIDDNREVAPNVPRVQTSMTGFLKPLV